jgi:hypothetical protein
VETYWECKVGFSYNSFYWGFPQPESAALLSCSQIYFEGKHYFLKTKTLSKISGCMYSPTSGVFNYDNPNDKRFWFVPNNNWFPTEAIPRVQLIVGDDRIQTTGDRVVGLHQTFVRRLKELSRLKGSSRVVVSLCLTHCGIPVQVEIKKVFERVGRGIIEVVME